MAAKFKEQTCRGDDEEEVKAKWEKEGVPEKYWAEIRQVCQIL